MFYVCIYVIYMHMYAHTFYNMDICKNMYGEREKERGWKTVFPIWYTFILVYFF